MVLFYLTGYYFYNDNQLHKIIMFKHSHFTLFSVKKTLKMGFFMKNMVLEKL